MKKEHMFNIFLYLSTDSQKKSTDLKEKSPYLNERKEHGKLTFS